MASKIDIASNALVLIGDDPISSFTEDGSGAQAVSNLYDATYEELLSKHFWGFARAQAVLSKLVASPLFDEFDAAYQMPAGVLRVMRVDSRLPYQIYEDKLYTNETGSLNIEYIFKPSEGRLPGYFVATFEYLLASKLGLSVTQASGDSQMFHQKYLLSLSAAMGADSQNDTTVSIQSSPYTDVRG